MPELIFALDEMNKRETQDGAIAARAAVAHLDHKAQLAAHAICMGELVYLLGADLPADERKNITDSLRPLINVSLGAAVHHGGRRIGQKADS